jgi:hypothetical protein
VVWADSMGGAAVGQQKQSLVPKFTLRLVEDSNAGKKL